jgi:hypothetical protein
MFSLMGTLDHAYAAAGESMPPLAQGLPPERFQSITRWAATST